MKLLRIVAPHFVAGAIWRKVGNVWVCERAAPIIKWMVGMTTDNAREYLRKKRWVYEWVAISQASESLPE